MPFARPGITDLRDQAIRDMLVSLGLPTLLRRSVERALAVAQAGLAYGQYGYLDWIARQSTPFTGTGVFLEAWAALVGERRQPATAATGAAAFLGAPGSPIPAGTALRRADGAAYATTVDLVVAGNGAATVAITAASTGSAYTINDGDALTLASPITGVQSAVTAEHAAPGTDPELDAPFRTRMLLRWSAAPQGGAQADYLEWALAVPGVTRAWVQPNGAGIGTVVVYTMWDLAEVAHAGFPQGTNGVAAAETRDAPATGDQLVAANAIFPLRPVTALVYSVAPVAYPVAFAIHPTSTVSAATQAAVSAAIDAVFFAYASALAVELETDLFSVAVAAVPGMPDFTLISPAAPILAPLGNLPVRGAVTYV